MSYFLYLDVEGQEPEVHLALPLGATEVAYPGRLRLVSLLNFIGQSLHASWVMPQDTEPIKRHLSVLQTVLALPSNEPLDIRIDKQDLHPQFHLVCNHTCVCEYMCIRVCTGMHACKVEAGGLRQVSSSITLYLIF